MPAGMRTVATLLLTLGVMVIDRSVVGFSFIPIPPPSSGGLIPEGPKTDVDDFKKLPSVKADVVCIGEVLYDYIAGPDCNGMSVEEVEAQGKFTKYPGGAPGNVAVGLSRLGVRAMYAGCLGQDSDGEDLVKMLNSNKVETVISGSKFPTRGVMVLRNAKTGDREFAAFKGNDNTENYADCHFNPPISANWLVDSAAMAVVMGTLGLYCGETATMMQKVADILKRDPPLGVTDTEAEKEVKKAKKPLLVVDLNVRDVFWGDTPPDMMRRRILDFATGADLIKLTDEEAKWAFGIDPDEALHNPEVLMPYLMPKVGVLVTGGEKGASYCLKEVGSSFQEAYSVKDPIVDTTGAGDAFTAGFLSAIAMDRAAVLRSKQGADRALKLACAAGSLTCTKSGAISALPSLQEVVSLVISNA